MTAKNALRTTKHLVRTPEEAAEYVAEVLTHGTAVRIVVEDDRGGQGTINVYVTHPRN